MALGSILYKQFFGGRLVRTGPHTIIETRPYLRLAEAQTLDFVAKHTSIPVPRVLDVLTANNQLHIVMDYILWMLYGHGRPMRGVQLSLNNYVNFYFNYEDYHLRILDRSGTLSTD